MKQAIAILAKAPRAGIVKTRLAVRLSGEEAAQLYRCFLLDTIGLAGRVREADIVVSYSPSSAEQGLQSYGPRMHPGRAARRGTGTKDNRDCSRHDRSRV